MRKHSIIFTHYLDQEEVIKIYENRSIKMKQKKEPRWKYVTVMIGLAMAVLWIIGMIIVFIKYSRP